MSFELSLTDTFWHAVRSRLPVEAQEAVLDLLDAMSAHPGDFIDRVPPIAVRGAASYPLVLTVDGSEVSLRVVFKYAADESTIFIEELLIDED